MQHDPTVGFDPTTVAPNTGASSKSFPVSDENGWPVIITGGEWKDNSNEGTGKHLALNLRITQGPHAGFEGTFRLNLLHSTSLPAVDMAKKDVSAISAVCGHNRAFTQPMLSELWNIPFRIVVELQSSDEAKAKGWTEVKKFKFIDGRAIGETAPAGAAGGGFPGQQVPGQVPGQTQQIPAGLPPAQTQQQAVAQQAVQTQPVPQQQQVPVQQTQQIPVQQVAQAPQQQQVAIPQQGVAQTQPVNPQTMAGIAAATAVAQGGAVDPTTQNASGAPKWANLPTG